uniref:Superoxide dismutase copper/zinc binding domain-containing protein n=1 Tax=Parascaris equorum TaxID=6256 RepID=A0A914RZW4_PAREQ
MVGGCDTMGNTFNPDRIPHSPFQKRHHRVGTLGNIIDGQVNRNNRYVSLFGRNSVLGRGIAIFENPDDTTQNRTVGHDFNGYLGTAIACGIIAR